MAGRAPQGADGAAVRGEMETVFLENLKHAAEVLAQVRGGHICVCGCVQWEEMKQKAGQDRRGCWTVTKEGQAWGGALPTVFHMGPGEPRGTVGAH